jgi:hypothetical protein
MGMLSESPHFHETPADFLAEWSYGSSLCGEVPTGARG